MKNIKQYFTNGTKVIDEKPVFYSGNAMKQEEEQEQTSVKGKRKRVKIRISSTGSKQMCDIIESGNDMIDKTPSPLIGKVVKDDERILQNGTPKSSLTGLSTKQSFEKNSKTIAEINGSKSEKTKNILQGKELTEPIIIDLDNSSNDNMNNDNDRIVSNIELHEEIDSQREESNAFQVLMNRSKSIQYKSPPQQFIEDAKYKEKSDDAIILRSIRKERLMAMADKKGYTKRKIAEMEEAEIIEKNIENRIRVFKNGSKSDITHEKNDSIGLQIKNKQPSGSKPIQYKSPPQQFIEDAKYKEKSDDAIILRSIRKERLMAMADKKGYTKRKIAKMEEAEIIEENIENCIRVFKNGSKSDITHEKNDSIGLQIKNKQPSGNLLDYFSKSSLELTNKNEKCVSTFIVKADVHRTDNSDFEPLIKSIPNKIYSNKKCSKTKLDLSTIDDIHIITSENLFSPQITKQDKPKREKACWSLRIKLNSVEDNDSLNDISDEELFSPKSKSKINTSSKSRNSVNKKEDNRIPYNGQIKMIIRNKKKKESIKEQKKCNVKNTAEDIIVSNNNGDTDICLKRSKEINKQECQIINISETDIMATDDSGCENILKRKPNEKLAPLFVKRRKTDPVVIAAKRMFLQSDITDMETKSTNCKMNSNSIPKFLFPAISHVTQLENKLDSTGPEIKHKFPIKIEKRYSPLIKVSNYKCITNYRETAKKTEAVDEPMKERNFDQVLSEIEELCPDVRKMWKTILTIKNDLRKRSSPRRGRKAKSLERKRTLTESVGNENSQSHECTWTCKYKPMSAQEVVGNEEAARKLKDWLSGWRASLTKKDNNSSGDEFYSSDCSSSYNNENNQIAVLLGPHGSGKSASVYAIAEELGYSVLEVNASSRRTGKRILKELEEATKSHRIKKNKNGSSFKPVANESEASKISKNSLIFLEDIDLIFEEDEGFISAAYQLALNTKRPIVMTCRDMCPHLSKMAPQQNKIYFQKVDGSRVSTLLILISLAEKGYKLPRNCLMKLLQTGDLRQALLQLQFLLLSGSPVLSEQFMIVKLSLWQDMRSYLYRPAIKLSKRHKTKRSNDTSNILNNLADDLDGLSLVSSLIDIEDASLDMSVENTQPNLSLTENVSYYSVSRDLSADLAYFISDRILYKDLDANSNEQTQNQNNIILKKKLNQGVDLALSHVTPTCLDRRIMALDYLPTARTICRAEESRSTTNYKRGNRFFHYLHTLNVPTASLKPNILAAAIRMLQDNK